MKVAIVHDYLVQMGGAERVVAALHRLYPEAPIFTTVLDRTRLLSELSDAQIYTSWAQRLPGIRRHFRAYLPVYPPATRTLDLRGYDVILSSSSAFAKGIRVPEGAVHICYCHTPMRFAWEYDAYVSRERLPGFARRALRPYIRYLQEWDVRTARSVDLFIANSTAVQERIRVRYGREAEVIFPPVETARFTPVERVENYYLVVSRLVSYKRIDLAVEAFNRLGLPLWIVGDGPDRERLRGLARPHVRFLGRVSDDEVADLMARCRGLVFPGEEDFGITPLEANAAGRPVIAYRGGGALDTVREGLNGLFFDQPDAEALAAAVRRAEDMSWDASAIRGHAKGFDRAVFEARIRQFVDEVWRVRQSFAESAAW
ncbi:MAG: glycosyltransferase [Kyrpidia sp.]|nr:glycosyltransferase [Kyrpidia sp.]